MCNIMWNKALVYTVEFCVLINSGNACRYHSFVTCAVETFLIV